jgi:hypothetical protein
VAAIRNRAAVTSTVYQAHPAPHERSPGGVDPITIDPQKPVYGRPPPDATLSAPGSHSMNPSVAANWRTNADAPNLAAHRPPDLFLGRLAARTTISAPDASPATVSVAQTRRTGQRGDPVEVLMRMMVQFM